MKTFYVEAIVRNALASMDRWSASKIEATSELDAMTKYEARLKQKYPGTAVDTRILTEKEYNEF